MRILYISHLYHPESGAPPERVRHLTQRWAAAGHDVTVLTGVPNHPAGKIYPGHRGRALRFSYTEMDGKVRVSRLAYITRPNRGSLNRALSFGSFAFSATIRSMFMRPFDVIVGALPQPFSPYAGYLRALFGNAKFVLDVRDLWPESIVATGLASESSLSYKVIGATTKFLYNKADQIVTVTDAMREALATNYQIDHEIVHTVPSAVDVDHFQNTNGSLGTSIETHTRDKFMVSYVGTMGNAHGLKIVAEAAEVLERERPGKFAFVFVGSGAEESTVRQFVESRHIQNVLCTGLVERNTVPSILRASDIGIVSLKKSAAFETVIPTKMYEYMAAGLPIVSNVSGQAAKTLASAGAGLTVAGDSVRAVADGIAELADEKSMRTDMSKLGLEFARIHASWDSSAARFLKILEQTVEN